MVEDEKEAAILLRDVARTVLGRRRRDRVTTVELYDRSLIFILNEMIVLTSSLYVYKAVRRLGGGVLDGLFKECNASSISTRAMAAGHVQPAVANMVGAINMSSCWNSSQELREATTLGRARGAARKLARENRWGAF